MSLCHIKVVTHYVFCRAAAAQSNRHSDEHRSSDEDDEALQRARAFDDFKDGTVFFFKIWYLRTLTYFIQIIGEGKGTRRGKDESLFLNLAIVYDIAIIVFHLNFVQFVIILYK